MLDSSVADQMTRLTLKLLEKKLEQERENVERDSEDPRLTLGEKPEVMARKPEPVSMTDSLAASVRAESLKPGVTQPAADRKPGKHQNCQVADSSGSRDAGLQMGGVGGMNVFLTAFGGWKPKIKAPRPPAASSQQLPPQPLVAQVAPPQAFPTQRSGSIKEDVVELMLLQNAQLHQVIMHSLMLRALPPSKLAPSPGPQAAPLHPTLQDPQWANPAVLRAERQKPPSVHHHHHYAPPAPLQAVPAPGPSGAYSMWPSVVSATTLPPATGFLPAVRHVPGPSGVAPGGVLPREALGL